VIKPALMFQKITEYLPVVSPLPARIVEKRSLVYIHSHMYTHVRTCVMPRGW